MLEFGSLADLARHLVSDTVGGLENTHTGLVAATLLLEKDIKSEFGSYQEGEGPFPTWAPLAEATKADRVAKGYPEDEPLLRDGGLRDSVEHEIGDWESEVGSTSDLMPFFELGTSKMPPRPVFGIALQRNLEKIRELIGFAAASGFVGGEAIPPELGYQISNPTRDV